MARMLKAFIDINALKHNFEKVRAIAKDKKILAMVKANGYGHGIVEVAKTLKEADAFGVACIEEALMLREAGISNRIVLMQGFFNAKEELPEICHLNLEPVIHQEAQIAALKHFSSRVRVWIKINTGMNRLGFECEQFPQIWQKLSTLSAITIEGFLTHFAKADEKEDPLTPLQIERFFKTIQGLPGVRSLANSAGILAWQTSFGDWVRPGIMLYGISPFLGREGSKEGLKPVMTLQSHLIAIQSLKKGEAVGYGGTFVSSENMRIGVVAVGYGDGYPRVAPNGTPVLVNGKRVALVGRVSMDMITVDLSTQPEANVGDPVQLWGEALPVEIVAEAVGTSAYELLTGLSNRVSFVFTREHPLTSK